MKRWAKRALWGVGGVALLVVLLLAAAILYLHTGSGSSFLRRQLVSRANQQLSGQLAVGSVRVRGDVLVLEDVVLHDPDGEVVAQVERVTVELGIGALLGRTVRLDQVRLERPELFVEKDAQGTNLQRALAPREPKPPQPEEQPAPLPVDVVVEALEIEDGLLTYEDATGAEPRVVALDGLGARGALSLLREGQTLRANLEATAALQEPLAGPLAVSARVEGKGEAKALTVTASLAGAKLEGRAELSDGEAEKAKLLIGRFELPPEVGRAFVPSWPLQVPLFATATADKDGARVSAGAEVTAGSGRLTARGALNLATLIVDEVRVNARGLDLAQLAPGAPRSDLAFTLTAEGGGHSLQSARGSLALFAPASTLDGQSFGPVRMTVEAAEGVATLKELSARLPGVALTAQGELTKERVALTARAAARDLGAFSRTLGRLSRPEGLALSGRGAVALRVDGPLRGPAVHLTARFPSLRYEAHRFRELRAEVRLPNAREPLRGDARVAASARSAVVGGKYLERPGLSLSLEDGRLALSATTRGFARLDLAARGQVEPDRQGLTLSRLELRYPEATWRLQRRAAVSFRDQAVAVEGLELRAKRQRISVDGTLGKGRVDARVEVENLALGRLPKALVDPSLKLGGAVDASVAARGRVEAPSVDAKARLREVRFKQYQGIGLDLQASWDGGRARGRLNGDALGVRAHGTFDLPVEALQKGRAAPLSADLTVERAQLREIFARLGRPAPLDGVAEGTLKLEGSARNPKVDATVRLHDATYQDLPTQQLSLTVRSGEQERLGASFTAQSFGEPSTITLQTPWSLGELLRAPPTAKQALRAPLQVAMRLRELPVPIPLATHGVKPIARGKAQLPQDAAVGGAGGAVAGYALLSGDVEVRGPALAPVGGGALELSALRLGEFTDVLARLELALAPDRNEVRLEVGHEERRLLQARVALDGALARLARPMAWTRLPFVVEADWGPIAIMDVQQWFPAPKQPGEEALPLLTGISSGHLRARGSLGQPVVALETSVHGLGSAEHGAMGDVSLGYRYAGGYHLAEADLLSGNGGALTARAYLPLELSYQSLTRGLRWRRANVSATLTAEDFDPSFLSGISPAVQRLGGRIDSGIWASGPLGLPKVAGRFEWSDGALALAGRGEYTAIHLLVEGSDEQAEVKELYARSGAGHAKLQATLVRQGEQVDFDGTVALDRFAVVNEDQLVATVSSKASARGQATVERIDVPELKIDEARVELPSTARKELQPLEPPEHVTFVWNGEPLAPPEEKGKGGGGGAGAEVREIELHLVAPRNLWVKGEDLNVEVGLEEGFRVLIAEETQLFGEVKLLRGHLSVLGRRFELRDDSRVRFAGPAELPRLDVAAIYENSREDITVTLTVQGEGKDLQIVPSSDPPMSETEIYTVIATGRRSLRGGSTTAGGNAATSLLGSLAAAQLKKQLEAALPLDVLNIQAGERGIAGTRVEAGMYVTDRLYLGIESELGAQRQQGENQNQLNVEYQLWRQWMLELEYGDAREGSADLLWRKRY